MSPRAGGLAVALVVACATPGAGQQVRRAAPAMEARPLARAVVVPMSTAGGRPTIDVTIDGRGPYRFIVDIGAMGSLVDATLAAEVGLPVMGRARVGDPSGDGATEAEVVGPAAVALGGGELSGLLLISLDTPDFWAELDGARGILGAPAFAGNVMTFDFPGATFGVAPGGLTETDGSLPFLDSGDGLPRVRVEVEGRVVEADLDTGSGRGLGLPRALVDSVSLAEPLSTGTARSVASSFEVLESRLAGSVMVGGVRIESPPVHFQDRFEQGNAGAALFRDWVLVVDPLGRRYRVQPPQTSGSSGGSPAP